MFREEAQKQYEEERRKRREKEEYKREKMREGIRQKYGIEKKKEKGSKAATATATIEVGDENRSTLTGRAPLPHERLRGLNLHGFFTWRSFLHRRLLVIPMC